MSEILYTGKPMTLEEFKELVRDLESQGITHRDPFEHIKYTPLLQQQIDDAFKEYWKSINAPLE